MKYSQIFGKIINDAKLKKNDEKNYLYRGGYLQKAGNGLASFLPLGWRVAQNIQNIIREEVNDIEGQELHMPFLVPFKYMEKSGRADLFSKELAVFKTKQGKFYALSPAHEEAMVELVRNAVSTHEDLPLLLYQFQSKYRDLDLHESELLTPREFLLHDAYSFHLSYTGLNNFMPKIFSAYEKVFERCDVNFIPAESGRGFMGGERAFSFLSPYEDGNDTVIECEKCGYTANKTIAKGIKQSFFSSPKPMKKVKLRGTLSYSDLAKSLSVDIANIIKAEIFRVQHGFVMALVRADYEISKEKLSHYLHDAVMRPANRMEIEAFNLVNGFFSPIGIDNIMEVIIDETVADTANLVMGANEKNHYFVNANFGVDFESDRVADIAMLKGKDHCNQCGAPLKETSTIEIGKIFKLSDLYSKKLKLSIKNEKGRDVFLHMGSYRIDIYRLLSAIATSNCDDKGLIWPEAVAPFKYYLIGVGDSLAVKRELNLLYNDLKSECLFDDRKLPPAAKFRDADLLGIPYRIVVSEKLIKENQVEIKNRRTGQLFEIDVINVKKALTKIKEDEYFIQ